MSTVQQQNATRDHVISEIERLYSHLSVGDRERIFLNEMDKIRNSQNPAPQQASVSAQGTSVATPTVNHVPQQSVPRYDANTGALLTSSPGVHTSAQVAPSQRTQPQGPMNPAHMQMMFPSYPSYPPPPYQYPYVPQYQQQFVAANQPKDESPYARKFDLQSADESVEEGAVMSRPYTVRPNTVNARSYSSILQKAIKDNQTYLGAFYPDKTTKTANTRVKLIKDREPALATRIAELIEERSSTAVSVTGITPHSGTTSHTRVGPSTVPPSVPPLMQTQINQTQRSTIGPNTHKTTTSTRSYAPPPVTRKSPSPPSPALSPPSSPSSHDVQPPLSPPQTLIPPLTSQVPTPPVSHAQPTHSQTSYPTPQTQPLQSLVSNTTYPSSGSVAQSFNPASSQQVPSTVAPPVPLSVPPAWNNTWGVDQSSVDLLLSSSMPGSQRTSHMFSDHKPAYNFR